MISIESSGKTVKLAIEQGLKKLNKPLDEVDIKIVSQGGFMRKAKVCITVLGSEKSDPVKEDAQKPIEEKPQRPVGFRESMISKADEEKPAAPAQKGDFNRRERKPFAQNKREFVSKFPKEGEARVQNEERPSFKSYQNSSDKDFVSGGRIKTRDTFPESAQNKEAKEARAQRPQRPYEKRNAPRKEFKDFKEFKDSKDLKDLKKDGEKEHYEKKERQYAVVTPQISAKAEDFIRGLLQHMGIDGTLEAAHEEREIKINVVCESGTLIGYRGETLDALEYLTSLAVNSDYDVYYKVSVDCNGYRSKRGETLGALAQRMADKALKTNRKIVLEPMSSGSRKIIHSFLSANDKLITRSEGREPNRRIVIIPKRDRS